MGRMISDVAERNRHFGDSGRSLLGIGNDGNGVNVDDNDNDDDTDVEETDIGREAAVCAD